MAGGCRRGAAPMQGVGAAQVRHPVREGSPQNLDHLRCPPRPRPPSAGWRTDSQPRLRRLGWVEPWGLLGGCRSGAGGGGHGPGGSGGRAGWGRLPPAAAAAHGVVERGGEAQQDAAEEADHRKGGRDLRDW